MILYALYVDAIFSPCHPYIWSTTVLHEIDLLNNMTIIYNKISSQGLLTWYSVVVPGIYELGQPNQAMLQAMNETQNFVKGSVISISCPSLIIMRTRFMG